jgi:hypothetical protein
LKAWYQANPVWDIGGNSEDKPLSGPKFKDKIEKIPKEAMVFCPVYSLMAGICCFQPVIPNHL